MGVLFAWLAMHACETQAGPPALTRLNPAAGRPAKSSEPVTQTMDERRVQAQRWLDEALALRRRLSSNDPEIAPPPGTDAEEVQRRDQLAELLIFYNQATLHYLNELEDARLARELAENKARAWTGFDEPPPYSILLVDQLRVQVDSARVDVEHLESSDLMFREGSDGFQQDLRNAQTRLRLAETSRDDAGNLMEEGRALWLRNLAQLEVHLAAVRTRLNDTARELNQAKLAVAKADLALAERRFTVARQSVRFERVDLDKARALLRAAAQDALNEFDKARAADEKHVRQRDSARTLLERAGPVGEGSPEYAVADARLRAAEAWLNSDRSVSEALTLLEIFLRKQDELWGERYLLAHGAQPSKRLEAVGQIRRMLEKIAHWLPYIRSKQTLLEVNERKQRDVLATLASDAPIRPFEEEIAAAQRRQGEVLERFLLVAEQGENSLQRWLKDYEATLAERSWTQRLADGVDIARGLAGQAWNFELFTVEDSLEVDGQKVITNRSVTFGKSVGGILLFVLGYWLAARLSGYLKTLLVLRFRVGEEQANVVRRWALAACATILLVLALNLVNIPLTVFAFLGGALAIGFGFGAQTLIKNMISGVMIFVEKKVKVGDIVEVDGIVGTVTEIDIRSSTLRSFDGVETVVPNATFVENNITNWTYTSPRLRRSVKVGVVYGSPVKKVTAILLDCAQRHGEVLKEPEPFVWLEDFGDNALIFALYFWMDMGPKASSMRIMSDIRFMILKQFADAGVAIAFPQREVRLDSTQPLRIEMVEPT